MKALFKALILIVLLSIGALYSCNTIQQAKEVARLKTCTFSYNGIDSVSLAGIRLNRGISLQSLSGGQMIQLAGALLRQDFPVSFQLMMDVENPNRKAATLTKMDYIVLFDGVEVLNGSTNQHITLAANSQTLIRLPLQTELFKALANQTQSTLNAMIGKLSGKGSEPLNVVVKVKPYLNIGSKQLPYPGYFSFSQQY